MNLEEFDAQMARTSSLKSKSKAKKPTEKEKKIQSQLKLGGNFINPETGVSTEDSLTAGGPYIPERFKKDTESGDLGKLQERRIELTKSLKMAEHNGNPSEIALAERNLQDNETKIQKLLGNDAVAPNIKEEEDDEYFWQRWSREERERNTRYEKILQEIESGKRQIPEKYKVNGPNAGSVYAKELSKKPKIEY
jgi:hypothetical protein